MSKCLKSTINQQVQIRENSLLFLGGSVNICSHYENRYDDFSENWESIYIKNRYKRSGYILKGNYTILLGQLVYYYPRDFIANSQKLETFYIYINWKMDRENVGH